MTSSHATLLRGDMREILVGLPDESIDLILTDPPYLEEFIPLYGDLARAAARLLKPDGFLVCYLGHYHLKAVMDHFATVPDLSYFWIVSQWNIGGMAKVMARRQICGFKPILIYRKGKALPNGWPLDILTMGGRSKNFHAWEQDVKESRYLVQHYSRPGDTVLDPFLGSGTTGVASLQAGREFVGVELDPETFAIAKTRIERTLWQSHADRTVQTPLEEWIAPECNKLLHPLGGCNNL